MFGSKEFWKSSWKTFWNGILQNLPTLIITVGGTIVIFVANLFESVQTYVRTIPTDYILVPFLILLMICVALVRIYIKQKTRISDLSTEPTNVGPDGEFVTHFGVWWKVFSDSEYIEDFPYCVCCETPMKLIQTEWYEDEKYACPKTKTEYKLYDEVPRKRADLSQAIYHAYFRGFNNQFISKIEKERNRLVELFPDMPEKELAERIFSISPLNNIPEEERENILAIHSEPLAAVDFVHRNYQEYKKYFRKRKKADDSESQKSENLL